MTEIQNYKRFSHLNIRILILFRISDFVLRISKKYADALYEHNT